MAEASSAAVKHYEMTHVCNAPATSTKIKHVRSAVAEIESDEWKKLGDEIAEKVRSMVVPGDSSRSPFVSPRPRSPPAAQARPAQSNAGSNTSNSSQQQRPQYKNNFQWEWAEHEVQQALSYVWLKGTLAS